MIGSGKRHDRVIAAPSHPGRPSAVGISLASHVRVVGNTIADSGQGGVFVFDGGRGVFERNVIVRSRLAGVELKSGAAPVVRGSRYGTVPNYASSEAADELLLIVQCEHVDAVAGIEAMATCQLVAQRRGHRHDGRGATQRAPPQDSCVRTPPGRREARVHARVVHADHHARALQTRHGPVVHEQRGQRPTTMLGAPARGDRDEPLRPAPVGDGSRAVNDGAYAQGAGGRRGVGGPPHLDRVIREPCRQATGQRLGAAARARGGVAVGRGIDQDASVHGASAAHAVSRSSTRLAMRCGSNSRMRA